MQGFQVRSEGPLSHPLRGTAYVGGAKNSALKLMAAALLADGPDRITNVPDILDVHVMARLLEELGCTVEVEHPAGRSTRTPAGRSTIDVPDELEHEAPYDLVRRLRASISVLGPLVARCGRAGSRCPGGDNIGSRGLDMHMTGLTELGAQVRIEHGFVVAEVAGRLTGANLWLDFPSVGATENLLMAVGARRRYDGHRQRRARAGDHRPVRDARRDGRRDRGHLHLDADRARASRGSARRARDRRRTGSWPAPGRSPPRSPAVTLTVHGGRPSTSTSCSTSWSAAGADGHRASTSGFRVHVDRRLESFDVVTLPYPGFPTDLQPFAMALAAVSDGTAMITENVFEARFMFAQELARLGADLRTDGHHAVVRGKPVLSGAPVVAHDIRPVPRWCSRAWPRRAPRRSRESQHIDRGYPYFVEMLSGLGADVSRVDVPDLRATDLRPDTVARRCEATFRPAGAS